MKTLHTLLIDPASQTIEPRSFVKYDTSRKNWLREVTQALGCQVVDAVNIDDTHSIIVDDLGLFDPEARFFAVDGHIMAGKGLVIGRKKYCGAAADCTLTPNDLIRRISYPASLLLP